MGKKFPEAFFVLATSQSPGLPETLATAYNPGMRLLAHPVIHLSQGRYQKGDRSMEEIKGKEIFMNPYVVQMDKFADSLKHLSRTFLKHKESCLGENRVRTYQAMHEILCAAAEYGAELNVELKRKLKKQCILAPRFLRETLEVFENAKEILLWNNRMVQNREGYAGQLTSFARLIQYTTRELDAGIFADDHMEKRLKTRLKKAGVRMLSAVFYMTPNGKYEIHLTVKTNKGQIISARELAKLVSGCVGKEMSPGRGERPVIGEEYCTVAFMEGARYQTLQGVARIGKGCEKISGDTFLMTELPGGKQGIALSDGMGSGEDAFRESSMVVEMLEELLGAGFPVKTAVQMMNTALVIGREEVRFCTVDVSLFDLYEGTCEFVKAGAAATFLKRRDQVEIIRSATLPIGVLQDIEIVTQTRELQSGDYVVMVTDGVMDALPAGEQETLMQTFIRDTEIVNPKELAHHILGRVLEWSGEVPLDDMTVLAAGVWKK